LIEPPKHEPYKVHLVESSQTDDDTQQMFDTLAKRWNVQPPMLGDVPIQLEIYKLQEDSFEAAKREAEALINNPNTLMVIGHLPSGLTEESLPIYLRAKPPVPYISTTASDDDLLAQCKDTCGDATHFAPLIQPSPRNVDQGASAVRFALLAGGGDFLL
jgi:ABC-type branched-subunit amino acid transport system substrate-binding protein